MMGFPFGRFRRRPVSIEPLGAQDSHAIQRIHAELSIMARVRMIFGR